MADRHAAERERWLARNAYFHETDYRYMQFLIPPGLRVLELGCGTGRLLSALRPAYGVGVDLSPEMVAHARRIHPDLQFLVGDAEDAEFLATIEGKFDVIVLSDVIGSLLDCQATLALLHRFCVPGTRLVIAYYSKLWEPVLNLAVRLGQKMPQPEQNVLSPEDIQNLLDLAGYETVRREWRQLVPRSLFGLGTLLNRFVAPLPLIRRLCLRNYVVARPTPGRDAAQYSATVVVPCRNERGNVEEAVRRIPRFCRDIEILFVEGGSRDGTLEEIRRVIAAYPELDIKVVQQTGKGKGDAVRAGFALARGDVLIIMDGDITVRPEDMGKFHEVLASGKAEFANGSRFVYPMEDRAMRFLNYLANRTFSALFTWLLNQRFTDTLCGTKALRRVDYERLVANRHYFGDFDPFGDFDLIFGAAKLNLKVVEIPVPYASRSYGETQISRFTHGWLLLKMVVFAFRKLKAF